MRRDESGAHSLFITQDIAQPWSFLRMFEHTLIDALNKVDAIVVVQITNYHNGLKSHHGLA